MNQNKSRVNTAEAYERGYQSGVKRERPQNPYEIDSQDAEDLYASWEEGYMAGYPDRYKITYK